MKPTTNPKNKETVTCLYRGTTVEIPLDIFLHELFGYTLKDKKFVRYAEGAELFGMSQSEFNKLAHEADAIYKRNKMALVKVDLVMDYLEYFRVIDE